MQAVNAQLLELLTSLIEAPTCYVWAQLPVINTTGSTPVIQYGYLGSQKILGKITSMTVNRLLAIGSNSMDFTMDNSSGDFSPLDTTQKYSGYLQTGLADLTYQAFLGVTNDGAETILPVGIYLSNSNMQDVEGQYGTNTMTFGGLDQFSLFQGDIYTSFPPRLYGQQTDGSSYYTPNYNLANPSGDLQFFVCDSLNWMVDTQSSVLWAANFIQPNVYVTSYHSGNVPCPEGTPFTMNSTSYTMNYSPITGYVVFNPAIPATTVVNSVTVPNVVSVDCTGLSMSPEVALYHLFVDYGEWNPAFLKFDCTGIQIPVVEVGREVSIIQAATDIVNMIAPRGQRWRLWIDEIGYIRLTEGATDHVPVKYLVDTRDLLKCTFQKDTNNLYNVVRANGVSVNNQPITAIAYDVLSINLFSQQPTYDVPSQYLNILQGMDPGAAMSYANGLVSSFLFQYSRPEVTAQVQIMPDTTLQTGDLINIVETSSGISSNWVIQQINDQIQESSGGGGETWNQTLYLSQMNYAQDMNFGIQANIGAPSPNNANTIQAQSGFIETVSFQTASDSGPVLVVSGGQPVYGPTGINPIVYTWKQAQPLTISVTIAPPTTTGYNGTIWMWRWMYIGADSYTNDYSNYPGTYVTQVVTGAGTMIGETNYGGGWPQDIHGYYTNPPGSANQSTYPYDVRANTEPNLTTGGVTYVTPTARRFWRPLLVCPNWFQADGIQGYTYNASYSGPNQPPYNMQIIGPSFTFTDVWTAGVGPYLNYDPFNSANNQVASFYGMLRVAQNNYFNNTSNSTMSPLPSFRGQEIYASGTAGSEYLGTSSTISFGVDFGQQLFNNNGWTLNSQIIGLNNFVIDSEFNYISGVNQQWTLTNMTVGTGGAGYHTCQTTVGSSTTATAVGSHIPVNTAHNPLQTGTPVVFSCFIKALVTSGSSIQAFVKNDAGTTVATLTQTAGSSGLLQATWNVGGAENYYVVHFSTGTFVAGGSGQISYSQCMLTQGTSVPTSNAYVPSTVVASNLFYGITSKITPCFLQILTATNFGTMELKTIQFNLEM